MAVHSVNRVVAVVEGSTEQAFVQRIVQPHLNLFGVSITARILGEPGHKGGNVKLSRLAMDVSILLKQEVSTYVTTLVDLYGLGEGWPMIPVTSSPENALDTLCNALRDDVNQRVEDLAAYRFLPYVQAHETEAFLFVNPLVSAEVIGNKNHAIALKQEADSFDTPEHINCGQQTAPSKRIQRFFPAYQKGRGLNAHLPMVCEELGINAIRQKCPLFDKWILSLESIGS